MCRHRGLRPVVDRDAAVVRIDGDAGLLQPEIGDVGMPADREHHLVGGDARSVRQMRGEFLAVLVDLVDGAAGEDGDALLLHLGAHMGADVLVEAAQDVVAAIDHGHVGAEAGEDAGEFQRDIAAALDHDALRQFGRGETPRWRRSRARCRESPARDWARRRSRSGCISR